MTYLLIFAVCFLAGSNGANDNFKGVASLYGSGATSYRKALAWATTCTFAGSVAAIFLAVELLKRFSGKGLVPEALAGSSTFLVAVSLGAGLTVLLATWTGFPISTTHALIGAMIGSGLCAVGLQVNLALLGKAFLLPLLLSPLLAVGCGAGLYVLFRWLRLRTGVTKDWCVCVGEEVQRIPIAQPASCMAVDAARPEISVSAGEVKDCQQRYTGKLVGIPCQRLMDAAHFLSAGVVSFARGLNDTPKIAALLLVLPAVNAQAGLLAVGMAMAVGGILGARRVAETMSHKITAMNHGQGFSANLSTGLLVIGASLGGMPVSTTHVSVGALFGIGIAGRRADFGVVRKIVLSWVVTLPCAAICGVVVYLLVQ